MILLQEILWYSANTPLTTWFTIIIIFCIKHLHCLGPKNSIVQHVITNLQAVERCKEDRAYVQYISVYVCSVGAVGAPVVGEEADFSLPSRKDTLQACLLWRVTHVL